MNKAILLLAVSMFLAGCGGSGSSPAAIDTTPVVAPSSAEVVAVTFMREEEKLARDVYLGLYDIWGLQIFANIAESEQTHMDLVLAVIEQYGLEDPAAGKPIGEFTNAELQGLYDMLIAQGAASLIDALVVGATIEDLDIYDLNRLLAGVDNEDITLVFESLLKGSRNHMRAFHSQLEALNITYTPVYISQEEYDAIVNSPKERG